MYLSRLIIKNYRSIEFADIRFGKGKNVIIGRNNAGKSNIIKAIDLVLGERNPTYAKSDNLRETDFFTYKEPRKKRYNEDDDLIIAKELSIYCELSRNVNEDLNWDAIKETRGSYINENPEKLTTFKNLTDEKRFDRFVNLVFSVKIPNRKENYIKGENRIKKLLKDVVSFIYVFRAKRDKEEGIIKEMRLLLKTKDNGWKILQSAFIRTELLQSAIIPSFRDPETQLRLNQWSWYGKLMKHLINKHGEANKRLEKAIKNLHEVANEIFTDIKKDIETTTFDVAFPGNEIFFQLAEDSSPDIYKNVVIHIDDGFKSNLHDKGAGIQSATLIGLFSYYVKHVNTKSSALLCIEEPELYLHPHACRVINRRLEDFIKGENQVILSTHNPEFMESFGEDLNIILVRKTSQGTSTKSLSMKDYKYLFVNPHVRETLFADKVIICEGLESYILKFLFGVLLDEKNISVINAGGKDNIAEIAKLTTQLDIETYILADFDYILRNKDKEKIEKYNIKEHDSVEDLPWSRLRPDNGSKLQSKTAKLRNELKDSCKDLFYKAKHIDEFEKCGDKIFNKLTDLLNLLRDNGIFILDGEIEDLIKEKSVLDKGKFTTKSVFKVSKLLGKGEKTIEDLFYLKPLEYFINIVFGNTKEKSYAIDFLGEDLDDEPPF